MEIGSEQVCIRCGGHVEDSELLWNDPDLCKLCGETIRYENLRVRIMRAIKLQYPNSEVKEFTGHRGLNCFRVNIVPEEAK